MLAVWEMNNNDAGCLLLSTNVKGISKKKENAEQDMGSCKNGSFR